MARIFYTPQISMPYDIKFADCKPMMVTNDNSLSLAYYVGNYTKRAAWYDWNKGPFAPPFLLESPSSGATASYTVYFNSFTGGLCPTLDCHLQCTNQTISLVTGGTTGTSVNFCLNGERPIYHFDVVFSDEGERNGLPAQFQFTFEDSLGNQNEMVVQSISGVKPMNPLVGVVVDETNVAKAHVGVVLKTVTFQDLTEENLTQFIIERCDWPSRTNVRTFRGPLNNPPAGKLFTDRDIATGQEVAYRVRFENKWGEESKNSDWVIGTS